MPLSALDVSKAGAFPLIQITDTSGLAQIILMDGNPSKEAVFDLNTSTDQWSLRPSAGFLATAVLESNTIPGLDLSPFLAGGILNFSTTGVTVDPSSNTATVSEGATGSFILSAVPEPSTGLLAVITGSLGLLSLWCTRRRQVPT
jgi:hypothetical protein